MEPQSIANTQPNLPQNQTPPNIPPIKPNPASNSLIILLVVLILLLIGGLGYMFFQNYILQNKLTLMTASVSPSPVASATPDPTADWQIYKNPSNDYSLKFPPTWKATEVAPDSRSLGSLVVNFQKPSLSSYVEVSTYLNNENLSVSNFLSKKLNIDMTKVKFVPIMVDGVNGFRTSDLPALTNVDRVIVEKSNKLYDISFNIYNDQIDKTVFDQILSTFKFTNQISPSPNTTSQQQISIPYSLKSGWQTYTDSVAKFSIQYNTTPSGQYNLHQSLGANDAGKSLIINNCNTPSNSNEVCLEQYDITITSGREAGTLKDWLDRLSPSNQTCHRYYADITIAGQTGLAATDNCTSFGETFVIVFNGSSVVEFQTKNYSYDSKTNKITFPSWFADSLSTFKFTS